MTTSIISKRCSSCKQVKSVNDFTKNKSSKDGHHNQCKLCRTISNMKYSKTKKNKIARKRYNQSEKGKINAIKSAIKQRLFYPQKIRARQAVNNAIKVGKLPHPDTLFCYYCPAQAEQYHHHKGYEVECWLDVIPVCRLCDTKAHKKTG